MRLPFPTSKSRSAARWMYQSLSDEIQRRWEEIKHLNIEDRDPLPKITKDKTAKKLIRTGNQIIADIIDSYLHVTLEQGVVPVGSPRDHEVPDWRLSETSLSHG